MGILLYAYGLGELWFLRTKNCYIIPNTATISPRNAHSYVSQRSYKLPKDKTCVLNLCLCLTTHTWSALHIQGLQVLISIGLQWNY